MFHWPPRGGSMNHFKEIMNRTNENHEARLFTLYWPHFYPRGKIDDKHGEIKIEIERVNPGAFGYFPNRIAQLFLEQVSRYKPDLVLIGDGHWYKLYLADLLSRNFPTVVRFFAYEIICPANVKLTNRKTLYCQNDYFKNPSECKRCVLTNREGIKNIELWLSGWFFGDRREWAERALQRCKAVLVNNAIAGERLKNTGAKVEIIHGGVDSAKFFPVEKNEAEPPVIMAVGRFDDPSKDIDTLLEACKKIFEDGEAFTLLTVGGRGSVPDLPFIENIPWVSFDEIHTVYPKADIAVVPSKWQEPFGKVAIEAMACGKPVIASKVGGLQEIVRHGETGLLVEPGDVDGWEKAIKRLLNNKSERQEMGKRARETAVREYDWEVIMNNYRWEEWLNR